MKYLLIITPPAPGFINGGVFLAFYCNSRPVTHPASRITKQKQTRKCGNMNLGKKVIV